MSAASRGEIPGLTGKRRDQVEIMIARGVDLAKVKSYFQLDDVMFAAVLARMAEPAET